MSQKDLIVVCILGQPGSGKTSLLRQFDGLSEFKISEAKSFEEWQKDVKEAYKNGTHFIVYETELLDLAIIADFIIGVVADESVLIERCRNNKSREGDPVEAVREALSKEVIAKHANYILDTSPLGPNNLLPKDAVYEQHIVSILGMVRGKLDL
jgi:GTPase SAR1 family protein